MCYILEYSDAHPCHRVPIWLSEAFRIHTVYKRCRPLSQCQYTVTDATRLQSVLDPKRFAPPN